MSFEQEDLDTWYQEPTLRKTKAATLRRGFDVWDSLVALVLSTLAGAVASLVSAFVFFLACAAVALTVKFGASWGPDVVGFFIVVSALVCAFFTASMASSMLPADQGWFGAFTALVIPGVELVVGIPFVAAWALGGLSKALASGPLSQVSGWAHDFVTTGPLSLGNPLWAVPALFVCAVNALRHYAASNS